MGIYGGNMITNQILQNTLDGIRSIGRVDLILVDLEGKVAAATADGPDELRREAKAFADSPADSQSLKGYHFFKVYDEHQAEYILLVKGTGEDVYMIGKMAVFQLQGLLVAYKERYDKDNYIKNLLLDNLLLVDIYNRAKKLHIEPEARRIVFTVEGKDEITTTAVEIVRSLFIGTKSRDFVTAVDEKNIIIVRELKNHETYEDMDAVAKSVLDALNGESDKSLRISYGTIVNEIKDVSRSYKEAKMALDVGQIFYEDMRIIAYNHLGIGRLVYQLPVPLCRMFIKEVFGTTSPEEFDQETIETINEFFQDNLNVSETARKLFIHRNTLVYRLDKIQKITGLDIRFFDDAITFKIALMVVRYMKYMENIY